MRPLQGFRSLITAFSFRRQFEHVQIEEHGACPVLEIAFERV
jgi:hypothetical protein